MTAVFSASKPRSVLCAEALLWIWILWTTLYGIYDSWHQLPELQQMIGGQLQDMIVIDPQQIMRIVVTSYLGIALLGALFLWQLGRGKNWARSSFLWSFILQLLWTLCPPYHPLVEYLSDVPDIGLQALALYLLYTNPARSWFQILA